MDRKLPNKIKVCPKCGGTDIRVYHDETGFHFKCITCGNLFVFELSRDQYDVLKRKLAEK